jgi:hypothetical protein
VRPRACALVALAVALSGLPAPSRAACPGDRAGDTLARVPIADRVAYLRGRLEAERPLARAWSWTWGLIDGGLTAGQLAAIPFAGSRPDRIFLGAGAFSSALGVAQILSMPITPAREDAPGAPDCAALARLEGEMSRAARNEALGSGWEAQLGNVGVNAGLSLAMGFMGNDWPGALLGFGIGWLVGELQIKTQPTALVRDLERYRAGELAAGSGATEMSLSAALAPSRGGLVAKVALAF